MSGHNKWSKVKEKKGVADAKRSKIWTKIIREVTVSARMGGADAQTNPRLRKALDEARASNMPKDTIERALSRADKSDTAAYEELTYEGYGPGGVAILVDCMTDNRNRTIGDVRVAFNKNGGNLGSSGSVAFGFQKKGQLVFVDDDDKNAPSADELLEAGIEYGLDDVEEQDGARVAFCEVSNFFSLKDALERRGFKSDVAELVMVPGTRVKLNEEAQIEFEELVEALEDLDDVQKVWSNSEV